MNFLTKLERKYGKFAIPNLTMILIGAFVLGYLILIVQPEAMDIINLNPARIMRGEIWRLITWIVMPPSSLSVFVIITLMFYYYIGRTLENNWGDFRYTIYVLSGILFTDIGVVGAYLILKLTGQVEMAEFFAMYSNSSTYFLCMSLFLAFAFMFPDAQVLLMFVVPIKIKWLGYLDIAYLIYWTIEFGRIGQYALMVTVIMSVLNFILFYFLTKGRYAMSPTRRKRKRAYKREVRRTQILTRHKCAICGQTEEDAPNLEFRYCSQCKGNYEYCSNHLFTHPHKKY